MTDEAIINWPWGAGYYILNGFTCAAMLVLAVIAVTFLMSRVK